MHPMVPVLDGPNLNMPGGRGPEFRGGPTPAEIERAARGIICRLGAQGFQLGLAATARLDQRADRS